VSLRLQKAVDYFIGQVDKERYTMQWRANGSCHVATSTKEEPWGGHEAYRVHKVMV
jgi:hypothetical protein